MQQAMYMLQLPLLELETYLRQELVENPVLEEEATPPEDQESTTNTEETSSSDENEEERILEGFEDAWSEYYYEGSDLARPREDEAAKRAYVESSITKMESLTSHLLSQLRLATDDEEERRIGEWIIGEIDDRGYFTSSVEDCAMALGVSREAAEAVLSKIHSFEPTGIGARDFRECFLLQIESRYPDNQRLKVLIGNHLDLIQKRQIPKIAEQMNIEIEEVEELARLVATLEPRPARAYTGEEVQYVVPDAIVTKVDDEYVVTVTDDSVPRLRVSPYYRRLLADNGTSKEVAEYIKGKYRAAKWLLKNIEQRKSTIYRVTSCIVEMQKEFLDKGEAFLKPLTLQEVAERVGLHESTISRVTSGKYVDTPLGIFELKHFFSSSIANRNGDAKSSRSVRSLVAQLVDEEDKKRPLSDQQITDALYHRGLNIARRTVTKYRESLGILPSKLRKEY
jgi:RNA polymerase sigma-54 factor